MNGGELKVHKQHDILGNIIKNARENSGITIEALSLYIRQTNTP